MKSILGLVQQAPCRIDVEFKDAHGQPYKTSASVKGKGIELEDLPLYTNKDTIQGEVLLTPLWARKLEHSGIKVQLVGQIELANERGQFHDFVGLDRNLAPPGDLPSVMKFPFEFKSVEMMYDSYKGQHVRCRYLLRILVVGKGMGTPDTKKEIPIWVRNYDVPGEAPSAPIKMEVGIEDCLHIEFEYDKAKYHLADVVVGKIYFLLVRIKLKHMELEIRRRETTGAGISAHSESETLAKYEIMDGAPVRGENIPIRLYLSPYELTPSYKEVHNKFSVRYFLNLVLIDEEDRRYFKQQEITLYRQADGASTSDAHSYPARLPSNASRTAAAMDAATAAAAAARSGEAASGSSWSTTQQQGSIPEGPTSPGSNSNFGRGPASGSGFGAPREATRSGSGGGGLTFGRSDEDADGVDAMDARPKGVPLPSAAAQRGRGDGPPL